jgi:hypothetical protein
VSGVWLLRIALRSQPVDAARTVQPLIDLGFALESLDVSSLGAGIVSEDLPVVLGNPLHFKRDSGFAHANEYGSFGPDGKPNVRGASGSGPNES